MARGAVLLRCCLILLVAVSLVRPAAAQSKGRGETKLARQARKHKNAGLEHMKRRRLAKAIEEFQIAYGLSPESEVVYYLAQAYNAKQEYPQALYYYKLYREQDPRGAARRGVDEIIDALAALNAGAASGSGSAENSSKTQTGPPTDETETPPAESEATTPLEPPADLAGADLSAAAAEAEEAGAGKRSAGLATATLGLVAVGAGLYFAAVADDTAGKFEDQPNETDLSAENRDARRNGLILAGAGGAAFATGVVLYFVGRAERGRASEQRVRLTPLSGGAALSVLGRF
jgi:tetratricopeptide (TPR) repeat protein